MYMTRSLLLVLFLFATTTAMAEGFYAGFELGIVQIEEEDQGVSFEDNPMGWRLIAGFDVNENLAVEGSYINSGTAEDTIEGTNIEAELSAFVLSFVGLMPMQSSKSVNLLDF